MVKPLVNAIVLCVLTVGSLAADVGSGISSALEKHATVIETASRDLEAGFRAAIKAAANAEQLSALRDLLDARDRFIDIGEPPSHPAMTAVTQKYVDKRKESARTVYEAYRSAIGAAATDLKLDDAKALKDEMVRFVDSERLAIGLGVEKSPLAVPAVAAIPPAAPPALSTNDTQSYLEGFVRRFTSELTAISQFKTTAQKDEAHRAMVKKFDEELQKKTLRFEFPIENVRHERQAFALILGEPQQLQNIEYEGRLGTVFEPLKESDALALDDRSIYLIYGIGRLTVSESSFFGGWSPQDTPRLRQIFSIKPPGSSVGYGVFVQGFKTKTVRQ